METTTQQMSSIHHSPLLFTKLHMPRPSPQLVQRSLLYERLSQGMTCALALISAPAGFGKTTLIADYLTRSATPATWLSLEAEDNDLVRFLSYVIAALQTFDQEIGRTSFSLLQSSTPTPVEPLLTLLINDLTTEKLPSFVLVLDDYHVIENPAIHHSLNFLLEHLPPQMHLMIAARADPPLPLARLRGRGQLCELRAADLRFDIHEVETFLHGVMQLDLSPTEVAVLQDRTEGWIAGLQLAALSLRGRTDVSAFLTAFTGSHRFVLDYLSEEVFLQQKPRVQTFLLHTCILDRINGSLANAVTAMTHGQAMLEALEHANLFVVSLDDERRWYRYHHLFAEVLRGRLQHTQPDLIPELHRRASLWYEQHHCLDEAIEHALAGEDYTAATRLLEQVARPLVQNSTLLRWMEALPQPWLESHPHLAVLYAWTVVANGTRPWSEIEPWLQGIRASLPVHHSIVSKLDGEMAAMQTMAAGFTEEHTRTIELSDQTLALLPTDHWARGLMRLYQGVALLSLQQVEEAIDILKLAVALNEAEDSQRLVLIVKSYLAHAYVLHGQLHEALYLYQEVLQHETKDGPPLRGSLLAHGGLGNLLREWNDFPSALVHLQAGLELDQFVGGLPSMTWAVYLPLARLYLAQGKREEAFAALSHIAEIAHTTSSALSSALVSAWRARFHLALGEVDAATRWTKDVGLSIEELLEKPADLPSYEMTSMTLVRLAIAQGRVEAALPLVKHLLALAEKSHRFTSVLEVLLIQSQAYEAIGQREQALVGLQQAILRAEPEGYIRLFLDEGKPIIKLLIDLRESSPQQAYIQLLLTALPDYETAQTVSKEEHLRRPQPLVDPLSERELEVLQLIATGASNEEIAEQLVIAIGTVKRHVSNILGKLAVSNRTQAVAYAKAIGLL
jgi:LuxR family transcriptional regulator, maltose regulon positive regulatory protein